MKKILSLTLAALLLVGTVILASAATSTDYRYDAVFQTKTLPAYPAFQKLYTPEYSTALPGLTQTDIGGSSCAYMVPQALCFAGDYLILSAYDGVSSYVTDSGDSAASHSAHKSVLYVMDNQNPQGRALLTTVLLPENTHAGGVAFDGTYLWVSGKSQSLWRIPFADIDAAVRSGAAEFDCAAAAKVIKEVGHAVSLLTYGQGKLWIGTFEELKSGILYGYETAEENGTPLLKKAAELPLPNRSQGAAFYEKDGSEYLFVSRSYVRKPGFNHVSQMELYQVADLQKDAACAVRIPLPPMAEGIDISGDYAYLTFESAATPYSTVKGNLCDKPTDRVCALPLEALLAMKPSRLSLWAQILECLRVMINQIGAFFAGLG